MLALALFHLVAAAEDPPVAAEPLVFDAPPVEAVEPAPEPTPSDPVIDDPAFVDGMRYYDKLEFEKAAFRFRTATRATERGPAVVARAHLWLGLALAQADDGVSAREAFLDARRLDGSVELPADAPPMIRTIFDDAVAHVDATPTDDVTKTKRAPDEALPLPLLVGAGVAGAGVLALAGGAVSGALALAQADAAAKERFQDDALAAHEGAESMALLSTGLLVTGAAAAVAGATIIVVGAFVE